MSERISERTSECLAPTYLPSWWPLRAHFPSARALRALFATGQLATAAAAALVAAAAVGVSVV